MDRPLAGRVHGAPLVLLRIEAVAIAVAAIMAYRWGGQSWWWFAALILVPDLSMLAYLRGPAAGAIAYNAVHTLTGPALLGGIGAGLHSAPAASVALIWLAHIGIDRALGYGLKYPTAFGDTHLGNSGKIAR